mgnify:CR=1 FL=1
MDQEINAIFFKPPISSNFIGHQMAEVYKDQVYAPFLNGKKDLTILDIGANIGITSYYFSQFAKQVYSLEPSREHFMILCKMIEFNGLKNVKPIKKAIFMEDKSLPFFHNKNKTMNSLHMAVNDNSSPSEEVECITFDTLFENEKIEHVDFMKLDVEGSEVEVLSSEGFRKVAPKIDLIILEVHQWNGRHPNQIKDALKSNGFTVDQIPNDANILVAKK